MVVDDDQAILQGLAHMIRREMDDIEIITAPDGIEALEGMKGTGVDLLITDIKMPGMDGLELIRRTQACGSCSRFVILTGYDEFKFARQAIKYNVTDYLLKPIDREELLCAIKKVKSEIDGGKTGRWVRELPDITGFQFEFSPENCSPRIKKILAYIGENYRLDLSLEQIGDVFHLHPNYICMLFKNELNTTFIRYLNALRIRNGARMLLNEERTPISDIAVSSGFKTERQFYKTFKKYVALTPGEFRRQYGAKELPQEL